jgi:hypothetical protein
MSLRVGGTFDVINTGCGAEQLGGTSLLSSQLFGRDQ